MTTSSQSKNLAICAFIVAAAFAGAASADTTPLRTAVDANFAPHASRTLSGEIEGFQIDLGEALSRQLGRPIEVEGSNFAGLIAAMNAGRYDFLLAPVTATAERAENMLFTEGYIYTAFQFGVQTGAEPITSLEDLRGKIVAVNSGSAYDAWAQQNAETYGYELLTLDTFTNATLAVTQGRAYAQLGGTSPIKYAASSNPRFSPDFVIEETRAHWSLATALDREDLRKDLDSAVECLKLNGELVKISEKWFGATPTETDAEMIVFPGSGVPELANYDPSDHTFECK